MIRTSSVAVLLACGIAGLSACSFLPSTGPSASAVADQAQNQVHLEPVDAQAAGQYQARSLRQQQQQLEQVLDQLNAVTVPATVRILPGDKIHVGLWTQAPLDLVASGRAATAPSLTDLGSYAVEADGSVSLPYAGRVPVQGLGLAEAASALTGVYQRLGRFPHPQVAVSMDDNAAQHVTVTGASNRPSVFDWPASGMSLGEAITRAGGFAGLDDGRMTALEANRVVVMRAGQRFSLALRQALENTVSLYPGDRIILEREPLVRVQCLGGGWSQNTTQTFDEIPSLARVVAQGGGLNPQSAQGRRVYVLNAARDTVYQFSWDTLDGIRAAQAFPIADQDVIYISTSPSTQFEKITTILFSAAYPVATAKGL